MDRAMITNVEGMSSSSRLEAPCNGVLSPKERAICRGRVSVMVAPPKPPLSSLSSIFLHITSKASQHFDGLDDAVVVCHHVHSFNC